LAVLPDSIFVRDGDWFVPTDLAHGPWHADSQHGSAMSGLLARGLESPASDPPMQLTRLTIDLLRAAPFAPLKVKVERRHAGKSLEFVEAELFAGDKVCARAHAVRTRIADLEVPESWSDVQNVPPLDPDAKVPLPPAQGHAFHDALHLSPVQAFAVPAMWVRMLRPLVLGEDLSPAVRAAVAVDWVYACWSLRQWTEDMARMAKRPFVAINADNHLVLTRPPEGEWIGLDARASYGSIGAGLSTARVFDQRGLCGVATQTLLQRSLDKRPKAWG